MTDEFLAGMFHSGEKVWPGWLSMKEMFPAASNSIVWRGGRGLPNTSSPSPRRFHILLAERDAKKTQVMPGYKTHIPAALGSALAFPGHCL